MKQRRQRRSTKTDPNSPAAIIVGKFGGLQKLCDDTGLSVTTVYGWLQRGRIPAPQVPVLLGHAERLKVKIKPTDWLPQPAAQPEVESE